MRRLLIFAVALVAVLGMLAPPAMAQAPAPKVTITGLVDNVGTFARNMSAYDFNLGRNTDAQMYGRTRGRFDVIGEVGKAKAVFGLEIDSYWGQTGFSDSNAAGCSASSLSGGVGCGFVGSGSESSFDLNTDTQGNIQVKWLYTEFPLPLIPLNTVVRLGAQPFGTAATYKLAVYANGDFPGVNVVTDLAPGAKLALTYVAVEENLTGKRDVFPFTFPGVSTTGRCTTPGDGTLAPCLPQSRGEDWAFIASFEFSPFKGLDIKPMYSYFHAVGTTGTSRTGKGGMVTASSISAASGGQTNSPFNPVSSATGGAGAGPAADGAGTGIIENRHTLGVDARFTAGPFSLQPTVLYQWGSRDAVVVGMTGMPTGVNTSPYGLVGSKKNADIGAWLVDVQAGFNVGPLSLGGLVMWTSGQSAKGNPYNSVDWFQPLDTDTSYLNGWGTQITGLGIDYYQILNGGAAQAGLNLGNAIGYDKYGRLQVGAKAAYALTPALTVGTGAIVAWTDKAVDTDGYLVANGGIQPNFINRKRGTNARVDGESSYLGTEWFASLTYQIAPGLKFDWALGYLFAGPALGHRLAGTQYIQTTPTTAQAPPGPKDIGVNDVITTSARVRFEF